MKISVNKIVYAHPDGATLADLVLQLKPAPPFAVAVNMQFVPKTAYATTPLSEGDSVEVIRPVTGG